MILAKWVPPHFSPPSTRYKKPRQGLFAYVELGATVTPEVRTLKITFSVGTLPESWYNKNYEIYYSI